MLKHTVIFYFFYFFLFSLPSCLQAQYTQLKPDQPMKNIFLKRLGLTTDIISTLFLTERVVLFVKKNLKIGFDDVCLWTHF